MMMSREHIELVCKPGMGNATCRYLIMDANGYQCAKLSSLKKLLDQKVTANAIVAQGDNCNGVKWEQ